MHLESSPKTFFAKFQNFEFFLIFEKSYKPEVHGLAEDFIPLQIQLLFAKMQLKETPYLTTKALTKSFKWDYQDSFTQHDVQEFARVLFSALEDSFDDASTAQPFRDLFKGKNQQRDLK